MILFFYVAIGGFFGSILRFYFSERFNKRPLGTWIANITGSLLLAILYRLYMDSFITETLWYIIGVGFCGAYTTFSTFGNEVMELFIDRKFIKAIGYIVTSFSTALMMIILVFMM